jgi:hypothetical protein
MVRSNQSIDVQRLENDLVPVNGFEARLAIVLFHVPTYGLENRTQEKCLIISQLPVPIFPLDPDLAG